MFRFFLVLFFCQLYFFSDSQESNNNTLIREQREDFDIFKATIKECHIGLYNYNDTASTNVLFEKLENRISERVLTPNELFANYSHFISTIKCIHTQIGHKDFDKMIKGYDKLNVLFYYCDNQLFSRNNFTSENLKLDENDELLEINDEPILKIKDSLFHFISSDGNNITFKEKLLRNNFFTFYSLYQYNSTIKLKYIHKNDTLQSTLVLEKLTKNVNSFQRPKKQDKLSFTIDTDRNTAILTLPKPLPNDEKYKKELTHFILHINSLTIENLVIDLRDNLGGKDQRHLIEHLVKERIAYSTLEHKQIHKFKLKKYFTKKLSKQYLISNFAGRFKHNTTVTLEPKEQFVGNIYVLINGYTISAASNLASTLKEFANAKIVGEESGGGYKLCNSGGVILKLPNSKILIRIPNIKFTNTVIADYECDGVTPNINFNEGCSLKNNTSNTLDLILDYIIKQEGNDNEK
jgi:hypothetical protein